VLTPSSGAHDNPGTMLGMTAFAANPATQTTRPHNRIRIRYARGSTALRAGLRHRQAERRPPLAAPFAAAAHMAGHACWS
jgi:hypothetical protein